MSFGNPENVEIDQKVSELYAQYQQLDAQIEDLRPKVSTKRNLWLTRPFLGYLYRKFSKWGIDLSGAGELGAQLNDITNQRAAIKKDIDFRISQRFDEYILSQLEMAHYSEGGLATVSFLHTISGDMWISQYSSPFIEAVRLKSPLSKKTRPDMKSEKLDIAYSIYQMVMK